MMYDASDYLTREETSELQRNMKNAGMKRFRGNSFTNSKKQGVTELWSYRTFIMSWDSVKDELTVNYEAFGFSKTTCSHISRFLKEYTPFDYHTVKDFVTHADFGMFKELKHGTIICL